MTKRRRGSGRRVDEGKFWGEVELDPAPGRPERIRPTPDPAALVRSLGPPPLAVDRELAERHLVAAYEEAVKTASALAAANGILAADEED